MGTYVVTGAAGGMGVAVRRRIETEGHRVVGVDLRDAEVDADLSTPAGRAAMVREVTRLTGGALGGLVACAGLGGTVRPVSLVARVNYFGAVATLDGLLPLLAAGAGAATGASGRPAAVAIASNSAGFAPASPDPLLDAFLAGDEDEAARLADGSDGQLVYATSKRALIAAVRRRVQAWADAGVRLNAVAPGPVPTGLLQAGLDDPVAGPLIRGFPVPLGRWGEPEEIAEAVWFLLGPASAWTHGSVLFVDGGTDALVRPDAL